jgi:hypothetical protein
VNISATDPDGDSLILTAIDLTLNAAFVDSGNGSGLFTFEPDFTQSGSFQITFIISDGALADSEVVSIEVTDVNRMPVLAAIGSQSVSEGDTLALNINASDPDGDSLILSVLDLPVNAGFRDNGNGTGDFLFSPDYDQAGIYNIIVIAYGGLLSDSEMVPIEVHDFNRRPSITPIDTLPVSEGDSLILNINASDPDGDSLLLSASNLPENSALIDSGNGSGIFTFYPDFEQSGNLRLTLKVSDGGLVDSEFVSIVVRNVNRAPNEFSLILPQPGDTIQSARFPLIWHPSSDPDKGDTIFYEVILDTIASPVMIIDSSLSDTTYQVVNLPGGKLFYWTIASFDQDSAYTFASDTAYFYMNAENLVIDIGDLPKEYSLSPNYPNPFNSITIIRYTLPKSSHVDIEIYDILGRTVDSPLNQEMPAGYHQIFWNSKELPSGIYFYSIQAAEFSESRKMLLLK